MHWPAFSAMAPLGFPARFAKPFWLEHFFKYHLKCTSLLLFSPSWGLRARPSFIQKSFLSSRRSVVLRPGLSSPGQTSLAKGLHPDGCICCAWPVPFAADNILMSALAGGPWISRCPHPSTAQHPCSWGPGALPVQPLSLHTAQQQGWWGATWCLGWKRAYLKTVLCVCELRPFPSSCQNEARPSSPAPSWASQVSVFISPRR